MQLLGVGLLALVALPLFSKAPTTKITLSRGGRTADITDAVRLGQFAFSFGPGSESCNPGDVGAGGCSAVKASWIADWVSGSVPAPDLSLPRYDVTYHFGDGEKRVYVVYFAYSPVTKQGYIYLPGPRQPHYQANVNILWHGKQWEGHWFLATPEWTSAAQEVIARLQDQ